MLFNSLPIIKKLSEKNHQGIRGYSKLFRKVAEETAQATT
jgi:hypothetical protein